MYWSSTPSTLGFRYQYFSDVYKFHILIKMAENEKLFSIFDRFDQNSISKKIGILMKIHLENNIFIWILQMFANPEWQKS